MIRPCPDCKQGYDDGYRLTTCPHPTFAANDGKNNFSLHPESYLAGPEVPCVDCKKPLDTPTMHFNAPGTNWGAALHWFKPPAKDMKAHYAPIPPPPGYFKPRPIDLQLIIDKHRNRIGNNADVGFLWAVINDILIFLEQEQQQQHQLSPKLAESFNKAAVSAFVGMASEMTDVPCDCDVEMFGEHLDTCPNWKARKPHPYDKRQPQVFTDEAEHFVDRPWYKDRLITDRVWLAVVLVIIILCYAGWELGLNR